MSRFVRIRARSVGVREFNKAASSDYDHRAVASCNAAGAAAAARRQVMADVVGHTAVQHSDVK